MWNKIGIYKITNTINGKIYIGKSKNIGRRWCVHKCPSTQVSEYQSPIYKAMKKYGNDKFNIEILEECLESELDNREEFYISSLKSQEREIGYNIKPGGEGGPVHFGESNGNSKLTKEEVLELRGLRAKGESCIKTYRALYQDKMSISGFKKVWYGYLWKEI